ncbi:MAG: hypothetical protein K2W78_12795 [Xanthobacteraceae bacterium]|nr:hypothetical protein [Xanthobacteraceae bacterium]
MSHEQLPRISAVSVAGPSTLYITWKGDEEPSSIDLADWILSGGTLLAPLNSDEVFAMAAIGGYGTIVTWDKGEGDLAIDAVHLKIIADASSDKEKNSSVIPDDFDVSI